MLKEQLIALAMRALLRVYQAQDHIKKNANNKANKSYLLGIKNTVLWLIENQISKREQVGSETAKKARKSSIRPAKEIDSIHADNILQILKSHAARMPNQNDELNGKKSLAYLVWALGHAERASIKNGISVHDVSALLYKAAEINLYPINISRVVHSNNKLVRQISRKNRSKTYLLTEAGEQVFREKFL